MTDFELKLAATSMITRQGKIINAQGLLIQTLEKEIGVYRRALGIKDTVTDQINQSLMEAN